MLYSSVTKKRNMRKFIIRLTPCKVYVRIGMVVFRVMLHKLSLMKPVVIIKIEGNWGLMAQSQILIFLLLVRTKTLSLCLCLSL